MFDFEILKKYFIDYKCYEDLIDGLIATVEIAVFGLIIGIIIGTLIAVIKLLPINNKFTKVLNAICNTYVALFRGTPIAVQLLIFYFALPMLFGVSFPQIPCAIVTFGLNSGAYVSEIMRAGILSVDKGQMEAARSVGLNFRQGMLSVVLPQAIKNIIPTLGNEFISLIKETSIVTFIAIMDVTKVFQDYAGSSSDFFTFYITLALVYLLIVLLITLLIKLIEKRLRRNER